MSIEINLLQASVTALCTFFPEHIFSAVGKDFWLLADGGFKCDCRVSVDSHRLKRDMPTHCPRVRARDIAGEKLRVAHCSFPYSAFAAMKTGISASASLQSVRKS